MRRVKSAPANIAEMVNKKNINKNINKTNKNTNNIPFIQTIIPIKKKNNPIVMKEQIITIKNQKNIEKTFNNIMLDYINDKDFYNINDEESVILSIIYFYVCEKIFKKNNLREFMLFLIQIFIRYIFTHTIHDLYLNNEILINKILLLENIKH